MFNKPKQIMKNLSVQAYHKLRNEIWDDLISCGVSSDEDENFKAFDDVLGNHLSVDWSDESRLVDSKFIKASEYLSFEDNDEEIIEMVNAIEAQAKIDETKMIDFVDGVQPCEIFEYTFTCKDFLSQIN